MIIVTVIVIPAATSCIWNIRSSAPVVSHTFAMGVSLPSLPVTTRSRVQDVYGTSRIQFHGEDMSDDKGVARSNHVKGRSSLGVLFTFTNLLVNSSRKGSCSNDPNGSAWKR